MTEQQEKVPLFLRIMGIITIIAGIAGLSELAPVIVHLAGNIGTGEIKITSLIIAFALCGVLSVMAVFFIILGVRLILNKRKYAAATANTLAALTFVAIVGVLMLFGFKWQMIILAIPAVVLIILTIYLDPSLFEERQLQRKLRKLEKEVVAEERRLAAERKQQRGYITLNFFNIFWIFVVCCLLGDGIETVYRIATAGILENRTGMLFGPFSPIYGFGAVMMTVALNRFQNKPIPILFLVSAVIGGTFEFFVSWIMEFSFGIRAWDYTGTFLSIDGRTNFMFMCMWGMLGVAWIKALLPILMKGIDMIPWRWRLSVTTVCFALMLINGIMTVQSIDCWYERLSGLQPTTPIEQFYARNFDNDFMQSHFQTMQLDPSRATRLS